MENRKPLRINRTYKEESVGNFRTEKYSNQSKRAHWIGQKGENGENRGKNE